ncbi:uncharacterized protein DEA37_0003055, partial [Paragonimus westermani]
ESLFRIVVSHRGAALEHLAVRHTYIDLSDTNHCHSYGQAIASTDLQTADSGALLLSLTNVTLSTNITSRAELAAYSGVDPSLGCSLPSPKAFRLLREVDDPDMPWL